MSAIEIGTIPGRYPNKPRRYLHAFCTPMEAERTVLKRRRQLDLVLLVLPLANRPLVRLARQSRNPVPQPLSEPDLCSLERVALERRRRDGLLLVCGGDGSASDSEWDRTRRKRSDQVPAQETESRTAWESRSNRRRSERAREGRTKGKSSGGGRPPASMSMPGRWKYLYMPCRRVSSCQYRSHLESFAVSAP